jgi:hypothetical protein
LSTISGTIVNRMTFTIVAASSGDGDTIAAMFSGITFPSIATASATATNNSGTVTLYWNEANLLAGYEIVYNFVMRTIAANTALTSPITVTYAEQGSLTT